MHFSVPYLLLAALVNMALGIFIMLRNSRLLSGKAFMVLTFSVAMWCLGLIGFYSFNSVEAISDSAMVFYVAALLMNASLLVFSAEFLRSRHKFALSYGALLSWFVLSLVIIANPDALFTVGRLEEHGAEVELNSVGYSIYTLFILGYYAISLYLFSGARNARNEKLRAQVRLILAGLITAGLFASFFNIVLPWTGLYAYVWSGPLFTALFVSSISYAMLKHGLFDIRATAARAAAYLLSVGFISLVFVGIVALLSELDIFSSSLSTGQRLAYIAVAIATALLYQPMRNRFDSLTNQIFYRDSYDSQALIDTLNQTLVSTSDLEDVLTKTSEIIQKNLKTTDCLFYLKETSYSEARFIGVKQSYDGLKQLDRIVELTPHMDARLHSVEREAQTDRLRELSQVMKSNKLEVMARLISQVGDGSEGVGYIFVGPKRSGGQYTKQDLQILEIISKELVLAVENILRFEEIEHFNVTLQRKIDSATRKLKASNEKLLALDEAKDEFVSMASHQLRTPLTSIKGYISMVLEGDGGKITDTQKQMLGQAFFSSQRMVYLISDLLNVSRLRTGKFIIDPKPTNLADIIEDEINQLTEGAKAKDLTLVYKKPKQFPDLMLDDMKIRQVIMNFADNAIYYTPAGGKITLSLKHVKNKVEFTVHDTGIGVPKAEQHKLFTKFYRADNARKTRPDGTGLGIFMAKKVIVAQGGTVIFTSKEGKGSTFGFSFNADRLRVTDTK